MNEHGLWKILETQSLINIMLKNGHTRFLKHGWLFLNIIHERVNLPKTPDKEGSDPFKTGNSLNMLFSTLKKIIGNSTARTEKQFSDYLPHPAQMSFFWRHLHPRKLKK